MTIRTLLPLLLLAAAPLARLAAGAEPLDGIRRVDNDVATPTDIPADYKLLYSQDFLKPETIADFTFTDPAAWKISGADGKLALDLFGASKYNPPFRSPLNIALIKGKVFDDFVVEAQCLQTSKEYGHRDMVFVYGFQSPTKYYYTHIATAADDHAHNCFIVNEAPRVKFAKETTKGVDWGQGVWHKVRIERKASDGTVRVFYDDMARPIMTGEDKTFGPGFIGFGSFDDTGKVANIRVWGKSVENKETPSFAK